MKRILFVFLVIMNIVCAREFSVKLGEYSYGLTYITISNDEVGNILVEGQIELYPSGTCLNSCVDIDTANVNNPRSGILQGKLMNGDDFKLEFVEENKIKVYVDSRKPFILEVPEW